jgi:hypothetical protein
MSFFNDEPNIPLSWQHILNWGGLRGVIPLVLVYSLPDTFPYKEDFLQFTFATLLFTLFVNGLSIKALLLKLKLHLPRKEEQIIADELELFALDAKRQKLSGLSRKQFNASLISKLDKEFSEAEKLVRSDLLAISTPEEFLTSLKLQALAIERNSLKKLFEQGIFTETVYYDFDSELDLQQDAIEYPEIKGVGVVRKDGRMNTGLSFRKRLIRIRRFALSFGFLSKILNINEESLVQERYGLLRARLFTSYAVLEYLERVGKIITKVELRKAIASVREMQEEYIAKNQNEVAEIEKEYPSIVTRYQRSVITSLIN